VGHGPPATAPAGEATIPPEAGFWGQLGMTEEEIQQVHQALRGKGYDPGRVPSVTDMQTREAILAFQRDNNLPMTGTLDERTAAMLGVKAHTPDIAPQARAATRPGEPTTVPPVTTRAQAEPRPIHPPATEPRATMPREPAVAPEARLEPRPGEPFHFTKEDIEHVQQVLRAQGYKPGTVASLTDKQTMEAIRNFQRDNHLQVTGRIDEKTAALMGVGPYAVTGAPDRPEKLRPGGDDPPPGVE
jgi:peptidoglycan hydrolase-like protein with peptidoglycan-binding domain